MRKSMIPLAVFCLLAFWAVGADAAWFGPTSAPPLNNVDAPLSQSTIFRGQVSGTYDNLKISVSGCSVGQVLTYQAVRGANEIVCANASANATLLSVLNSGADARNFAGGVYMGTSSATWLNVGGEVRAGWIHATQPGNNTIAGNLGIGTAKPGAKLSFGIATGEKIRFWENSAGTSATGIAQNSGELQMYSAGDNISFRNGSYNGTEAMRIAGATGWVGIGTANPTQRLEVNGGLRLTPLGSAPAGGADGTMYYDSTSDKFRCWQGTGFVDCIGSGTVAVNGTENNVPKYGVGGQGLTGSIAYDDGKGVIFGGTASAAYSNGALPRLTVYRPTTDNSGADMVLLQRRSATAAGMSASLTFAEDIGATNNYWAIGKRTSGNNAAVANNFDFGYRNSPVGNPIVTNVLSLRTNGKVGIGTQSPNERLEITGGAPTRLRITDSAQNPEVQLQYGAGANDHWSWYVNQADDGLRLWGGGADRLAISQSGNIGIGTNTPGASLEVKGIMRVTANAGKYIQLGSYNTAADNFGYLSAGGQANGTGLKFETTNGSNNSSGVTRMTLLNNGNVGVGTMTPTQRMEVSGGLRLTPITVAPANPNSGTMYYDSTLKKFRCYEDGVWKDCVGGGSGNPIGAAGGDLSGTYPNPSVVKLQGRSIVNTPPTTGQILQWNGSGWTPATLTSVTGNGSSGYVPMYTSANTISNSALFQNASGNVGIGTATPAAASGRKLSIFDGANGPLISLAGQINKYRGLSLRQSVNDAENWFVGANDVNNFVIRSGGLTDDVTIDSTGNLTLASLAGGTNRCVQSDSTGKLINADCATIGSALPAGTNGQTLRNNGTTWLANSNLFNNGTNIGIGTVTPGQKLSISDSTSGPLVSLTGLSTNYRGLSLRQSSDGTETWFVGVNDENKFVIRSDDFNNNITVDSAGNVGIGNTAPLAKLEINSASNGVSGLRFTKLTATNIAAAAGSKVLSVDAEGDVILVNDAQGSTNFNNPTASIGLSPVNGSATTAMRSDAAPALSQSIAPTWTGIHTFNKQTNFPGSGIWKDDGSVGIGTTNPSSAVRLDVNGGIKLGNSSGNVAGAIRYFNNDFSGYDGTSWKSLTAGGASLPAGTNGQTLRHDGTNWIVNSIIFNNGTNVGIGNINPSQTLDVSGTIAATKSIINDYYVSSVSADYNGAPIYGIGRSSLAVGGQPNPAVQIGGFYGLTFTTDDLDLPNDDGIATPKMVLTRGGRLGIGTTEPATMLDVRGDANITGSIEHKTDSTFYVNSDEGLQLRINSDNSGVPGVFSIKNSNDNEILNINNDGLVTVPSSIGVGGNISAYQNAWGAGEGYPGDENQLSTGACAWTGWTQYGSVCADGRYMAGVDIDEVGNGVQQQRILCCEL